MKTEVGRWESEENANYKIYIMEFKFEKLIIWQK